MIEAQDLRINNYINKEDGLSVKVLSFDLYTYNFKLSNGYVVKNHLKKANPIKLTEQWLLDLGFESLGYTCPETEFKENFPYKIKISKEETLEIEHDFSAGLSWSNDDYIPIGNLIYGSVHKIQNLYYSLTGEELILKK